MKEINNIKKITNVYESWTPSDIAFIKGLELSKGNLIILFYSQLRSDAAGWPDMAKRFFEISITFYNVRDLKMELNGSNLYQVGGFDIADVSSNGLENVNYQIEDYENGVVSFCCENININRVSEALKIRIK